MQIYELAIIGGGPAGAAAGVYAARKFLKSVLITPEWGGQSIESLDIQNWIGSVSVSGHDLAINLEKHVKAYASTVLDIREKQRVVSLEKTDGGFLIRTSGGDSLIAKTVLIATGASRRKLTAPGAEEFENKGITYCASCDGPLFSGQDVAVIGGGNAGFETAAQLLAYAKSVTLLEQQARFKADEITVTKVLEQPHMTALPHVEIEKILGDKFVSGIAYKDLETGEQKELPVAGIFVEIGILPATDFVGEMVPLDPIRRIIVDAKNQRTGTEGIWAAGDCTDELYHQNNIAAGDGVKALEDIYNYLRAR